MDSKAQKDRIKSEYGFEVVAPAAPVGADKRLFYADIAEYFGRLATEHGQPRG